MFSTLLVALGILSDSLHHSMIIVGAYHLQLSQFTQKYHNNATGIASPHDLGGGGISTKQLLM